MASAIRVFLILCLFGSLTLAQAQTSGGLQIGFAIVTVDSTNVLGIAASETLSHTGFGGTAQTGVPPSFLLTNSALTVHLRSAVEGSTGIAIANATATVGNVQLTVTDSVGTQILNQTISILPRSQISRFLTELFAGQITSLTPATALLTITSDVPVAVTALNFRDTSFASLPLTALSLPFPIPSATFTPTPASPTVTVFPTFGMTIPTSPVTPPLTTATLAAQQSVVASTTIGGGASFMFPQVATGDGWLTQITVANTSTATQTIRIDFFDQNGVLLQGVAGVTILSHGLYNLVH